MLVAQTNNFIAFLLLSEPPSCLHRVKLATITLIEPFLPVNLMYCCTSKQRGKHQWTNPMRGRIFVRLLFANLARNTTQVAQPNKYLRMGTTETNKTPSRILGSVSRIRLINGSQPQTGGTETNWDKHPCQC